MSQQIQLRRDSGANWNLSNPILAQGEIGINVDTYLNKIGDGINTWNSLPYVSSSYSVSASYALNGGSGGGGSISASWASSSLSASYALSTSYASSAPLNHNQADWTFWVDTNGIYHAQNADNSVISSSADFSALFQYAHDSMGAIPPTCSVNYQFGSTSKPNVNSNIGFEFLRTVAINHNSLLRGVGNPPCRFYSQGTSNFALIQFGDDTHTLSGISRVESIRFESYNGTDGNVGLWYRNCSEPVAENCEFNGFKTAGVRITGTAASYNCWSFFQNCWFPVGTTGVGLLYDGPDAPWSELFIDNCLFATTGGSCIRISGSNINCDYAFRENRFYLDRSTTIGNAIDIWNGNHFLISGNTFDGWKNPNAQGVGTYPSRSIIFQERVTPTYVNALITNNMDTHGSFIITSGSNTNGIVVTGNMDSSSFVFYRGDGSGLTGVVSASYAPGSSTATYTSSLFGTASWSSNAVSASYAPQTTQVSASWASQSLSASMATNAITAAVVPVVSVGDNQNYTPVLTLGSATQPFDVAGGTGAVLGFNPATSIFNTVNIEATTITASLCGTASYTDKALSASYAPIPTDLSVNTLTASNGISASANSTIGALFVSSSGIVKIGNATGISANLRVKCTTGGNRSIVLERNDNANTIVTLAQYAGDGSGMIKVADKTNNTVIYLSGGDGEINYIKNSGGKLGIGTSNVTNSLDVAGNISCNAISASVISSSNEVIVPMPINSYDAVPKSYVDALNPQGINYYFRSGSSGISNYNTMLRLDVPLSASSQNITTNAVSASQYFMSFVSPPLNLANISQGTINVHVHIYRVGGAVSNTFSPEIYIRSSSGAEYIELDAPSPTTITTTTTDSYTIPIVISSSIALHLDDRLVCKLKCVSGTGTPNLVVVVDDGTSAGVSIPVPSSAFVLRTGDIMTGTLTGPGYIGTASYANNAITAAVVPVTSVGDNAAYTLVLTLGSGTQPFDVAGGTGAVLGFNPATSTFNTVNIVADTITASLLYGTASYANTASYISYPTASGSPVNAITPVTWIPMTLSGSLYYMPLYQ